MTRRRLLTLTLATFVCLLAGFSGAAQGGPPTAVEPPDVRRDTQDETGFLSFVGASPDNPIIIKNADAGLLAGEQGLARAALVAYGPQFGVDNPGRDLSLTRSSSLPNGHGVARFQQTYKGVPVLGGQLVVNTRGTDLLSINGEISPGLDLDVTPVVTPQEAQDTALLAIARAYEADASDFTATEPELWIFDEQLIMPSTRPAELVWRMEVAAVDNFVPVNEFVMVNAERGGISIHFNQIDTFWDSAHGQATSGVGVPSQAVAAAPPATLGVPIYETYDAGGSNSLPGTFVCDQSTPNCTNGVNTHADGAHTHALDTYLFYETHHGRDSFDDAGATMISTVHYDNIPGGDPYYNAFWNGSQMVYGDGEAYPLADDVVGHEFTHAVTDYTSNLLYYYQSGAINESFSDVWGEFIDQTNGTGSDTPADKWLMGEEIGAIRDMEDPTTFGDPDRIGSANYYTGAADSGGVHSNSGVNNKAAFLLTDGGTFNSKTVTGLGINKVAAIYYETQTNLLFTGADYKDLYNALYQGCLNVIGGPDGVTFADCLEVRDATLAVEMNQEPYSGYNPDVRLCPNTSEVPTTLFYDDLDSGDAQWVRVTIVGSIDPVWWWSSAYAISEPHMWWAYDNHSDDFPVAIRSAEEGYVRFANSVAIPGGSEAYLRFDHAFGFEDDPYFYDGGFLEYSTNGSGGPWMDASPLFSAGKNYNGTIVAGYGNPNGGHVAWVSKSHGYVQTRYNLSSLAGGNVMFRWHSSYDEIIGDLGWVVDNVHVYTCTAGSDLWVDDSNLDGPWTGTTVFPYKTITSAIAAASPGQTIMIREGIYNESFVVNKDNITLLGVDGAAQTIVCGGAMPLVSNAPGVVGLTINGLSLRSDCP